MTPQEVIATSIIKLEKRFSKELKIIDDALSRQNYTGGFVRFALNCAIVHEELDNIAMVYRFRGWSNVSISNVYTKKNGWRTVVTLEYNIK